MGLGCRCSAMPEILLDNKISAGASARLPYYGEERGTLTTDDTDGTDGTEGDREI
jgi:hypothetical protein